MSERYYAWMRFFPGRMHRGVFVLSAIFLSNVIPRRERERWREGERKRKGEKKREKRLENQPDSLSPTTVVRRRQTKRARDERKRESIKGKEDRKEEGKPDGQVHET